MLPNKIFFDNDMFRVEDRARTDIYEKDGRVFVEIEAPGYTKDDIDISLDKGELTVTFVKESHSEENKKYLHRERRSYSKITRSFYLGDVEEEEVDASFRNGILVVSSPKKKEIETKRTINIKDHE